MGLTSAWTLHGFYLWGFSSPIEAAGLRPELDIKSPFGAPFLIFPRSYHPKSFSQGNTSARHREFEVRVFPLLGELPKAIEPHMPVCQLYRWQLVHTMWSSHTTKSLNLIVVIALRVDIPREILGSATYGYALNCPVPEAWTTEASGHVIERPT